MQTWYCIVNNFTDTMSVVRDVSHLFLFTPVALKVAEETSTALKSVQNCRQTRNLLKASVVKILLKKDSVTRVVPPPTFHFFKF